MWHTRACLRTLTRSARPRNGKRSPAARPPRGHGPNGSVTARRFDEGEDASPQSARQYHDHWRRLLDLEWATEEKAVTERLERWPVARLEREGLCLTNLQHRSTGRFFERLLYRFDTRPPGSQPPAGRETRHEFQVGDAVILSRQAAGARQAAGSHEEGDSHPLSTDALKGELVELSADAVAVAVSEAHAHALGLSCAGADARGAGAWRMDRVANRTAYARTAAALGEFCGAEWAGSGVVRKLVMEEGHGGRLQPQAAQLRPWVGEAEDAELLQGTGQLLNPSQSDAVCAAYRASLSAVQGPPGTGKTAAACLLLALAVRAQRRRGLRVWVWLHPLTPNPNLTPKLNSGPDSDPPTHPDPDPRPKLNPNPRPPGPAPGPYPKQARALGGSAGPLLAAADSNAAADEMLSALLKLGVRAVRVGQPSRASRPLQEASLAVVVVALVLVLS